jgi:predicted DNA-binding protein
MKSIQNLPVEGLTENKGSHISLRVPKCLKQAINDRSRQLNLSRSAFIESAIEKQLEKGI